MQTIGTGMSGTHNITCVPAASDAAALATFAQRRVLAKAIRELGTLPLANDRFGALAKRTRADLATLTARLSCLDHDDAAFVTDLENMMLIPDDALDAPQLAWAFGVVAGMSAVAAACETASAAARVFPSDPTIPLWLARSGLVTLHAEVQTRWMKHQSRIASRMGDAYAGAVVDVDLTNPSRPTFKATLQPCVAEAP